MSIRARVCADAIEAAGADRVVTMDLHAPQLQGFFRVPVDDLYALPVLCDAIAAKRIERPRRRRRPTPASPRRPGCGPTGCRCRWPSPTSAGSTTPRRREVIELIGAVEGRTALIVDDFTISAGTLVDAARVLIERGAAAVRRGGEPRPAHRGRRRAARRQPDRAAVRDRHASRPSRSSCRRRSRSSRWPGSSPRPSAASPTARASASCSSSAPTTRADAGQVTAVPSTLPTRAVTSMARPPSTSMRTVALPNGAPPARAPAAPSAARPSSATDEGDDHPGRWPTARPASRRRAGAAAPTANDSAE